MDMLDESRIRFICAVFALYALVACHKSFAFQVCEIPTRPRNTRFVAWSTIFVRSAPRNSVAAWLRVAGHAHRTKLLTCRHSISLRLGVADERAGGELEKTRGWEWLFLHCESCYRQAVFISWKGGSSSQGLTTETKVRAFKSRNHFY